MLITELFMLAETCDIAFAIAYDPDREDGWSLSLGIPVCKPERFDDLDELLMLALTRMRMFIQAKMGQPPSEKDETISLLGDEIRNLTEQNEELRRQISELN